MTPDGDGRALADETVARIVRAVDETWRAAETDPIARGGNETWRVTVETPDGPRDCLLKAAVGDSGNLDGEARLLRLLASETDVPVPDVVGLVDDHPDLPAPAFLTAYLDAGGLPNDAAEIPTGDLAAFARDLGRHLGEVHGLDAFDGFGPVVAARGVEPDVAGGTRPLAREYGLTIPDSDPVDAWDDRFEGIVDRTCDRLAETRFGDLAPRLRGTLTDWAADLNLSGPPTLARIDHGPENLLADDGSVAAVLDWELARTTHREYDLACAEQGLCGTAPPESERRARVRAALYDGYRETNWVPDDARFPDRRRLYLLTFHVASMNWAERWITPDIADGVEREFRGFADALCADGPSEDADR